MPGKLRSEEFEVGLLDKYHLYIPEAIFQPFADAKHSRVKIKATHQQKSIEFYAAIKKDKNTDDYKFMFSNEKQKQLDLHLNDYFQLQLFEDTSKYGVEMPEELEAVLLSDYEAFEIFESFTKGSQRSIIYGIIRIKNSQSRIDKALNVCEKLKRGIKKPMELFKT